MEVAAAAAAIAVKSKGLWYFQAVNSPYTM